MAQSRKLTTVQAALRVLAYLAEHPEGLEATRVALLLGKSLSTAYALLASLVAEGFAEREGSTYRLSQTALAPAAPQSLGQPEKLTDALEELYLRTRERAYLGLLTREGRLRLSTRGRQGLPRPTGLEHEVAWGFHALALGKAVLAFLKPEEQSAYLQNLEAYTHLTITDPLALEEELGKVRQMGFAVELEEYAGGISGLAAPIFGPQGQVMGALGVVVPSRRFPYAFTRLVQAVQEVAKAASCRPGDPAGAPLTVTPQLKYAEPLFLASAAEESKVWPPGALCESANLPDYSSEYDRSISDPEGFWGSWAERFHWHQPWEQVRQLELPHHRWFVGGQTNITYNALDRHAEGAKRNQLALMALGGDGLVHKITYRELRDLTARLAGGLRSLGVKMGDRVAVYMPTGLETALTFLACARIGAVHVAAPPGMSAQALRERLEDTQARVLVAADRLYQGGRALPLANLVEEATAGLAIKVLWHSRGGASPSLGRLEFWELLEAHRPDTPALPLDSEHPLFILYTSGSTGKPKGVVHVHGGTMVGTAYHLRSFFDLRDNDLFWTTSDIGWIVGHNYMVYAPLLEGITSILREGAPDYPNPGVIWSLVERYRVNVMFTAPTAVRMFMKFGGEWPAQHDLSSLRFIGVAGEPLNPEAWQWAAEHLMEGGRRGFVTDNWWQTELGAPTLGTPLVSEARPGFVGFPLPGVEASVVDAEGQEVAPEHGGLLALRRPFPHMMRTIWGNHARYTQYWTEIPGQVYAAGDVASRTRDGYFTVLGRADDVLNVAGHRIGTADVESALVSHPAVAEAAVIGIPDPIKGENIKAFVVLRVGREKTEELGREVVHHVRTELGPIATPSELVFADKLPKTRSGKILRRLLKAQEMGKDAGDLSTLEE